MDWDKVYDFLFDFVTSWGVKLLAAIIILVVGIKITGSFAKWIKSSPKLSKLDNSLRMFLGSFVKILLYTLLIITAAMTVGVPATSFITILASCGVAIGLALQGALSNFAGGLMILFFKPFKVGDYITASGESGTVVDISVVYTVIVTYNNKRITIPNGALTNSVIVNYTAESLRRVDLQFGASYDCDVETVKAAINEALAGNKLILTDPAPFVRLASHDASALTYDVKAWCETGNYWQVYYDIIEDVKGSFDKHGISIPFQQIDVHVNNADK